MLSSNRWGIFKDQRIVLNHSLITHFYLNRVFVNAMFGRIKFVLTKWWILVTTLGILLKFTVVIKFMVFLVNEQSRVHTCSWVNTEALIALSRYPEKMEPIFVVTCESCYLWAKKWNVWEAQSSHYCQNCVLWFNIAGSKLYCMRLPS